jgi:hypothetical protein
MHQKFQDLKLVDHIRNAKSSHRYNQAKKTIGLFITVTVREITLIFTVISLRSFLTRDGTLLSKARHAV